MKIDELLEKSGESNRSEPEKDEERLVFIEPEVQKTNEQNVAEIGAQPINVESDEEHEEHEARRKTPKPVIPRYVRLNHSKEQIIGHKHVGVQPRRKMIENSCLISTIEPKIVREALKDDD